MQTTPASNRKWVVTPAQNGQLLEIGPAASFQVGAFVIQFNPSLDWNGSFMVMARVFGEAARDLAMSPMQVPYRRINVNGAVSDYTLVSDLITGASIIQIPANGLSIVLNTSCQTGTCGLALMDLEGPSSI